MFDRYADLGVLVRCIDRNLIYEGSLGKGVNAGVVKVRKGKSLFALKIKLTGSPSLRYEFNKQKALNGIYGVPEAIDLYGPDAFLMQLVDGKPLCFVRDVCDDFFGKLQAVAMKINDRGYSVPADFHDVNIIVSSKGDPWIVDFAQSEDQGLPVPRWVREDSICRVNNLRERYRLWNR